MTLKKMYALLDFLTRHAGTLSVAWTAILAVLVFFIVARATVNPTINSSNLATSEELEKLIKNLLERTQGTFGQLATPGANTQESQALLSELQHLQKELEEKNQKIQELNQKSTNFSIEEHNALKSRLQELEAKLAEYEIIAEDIADLSRYREENRYLKKKIEELEKRAPSNVPTHSGLEEQVDIAASPAPMQSTGDGSSASSEVSTAQMTSSPSVQTENSVIDDALLAEFAAAVEEQKRAQQIKKQMNAPSRETSASSESLIIEPPHFDTSNSKLSNSELNNNELNNRGNSELNYDEAGHHGLTPSQLQSDQTMKAESGISELKHSESSNIDVSGVEPMMDLKDLENEAQDLNSTEITDELNPQDLFATQIDTERLSDEAQSLSPKEEAKELLGEFEKFVEQQKGG